MDRSSIIILISTSYEKDAIAQQIPKEEERRAFCNIQSISLTEWAEAGRNGLRPEWKVTMFSRDYHGEKIAELNGKRYGIYRTYFGKNETIELYLEEKAGV